MCFSSTKGKPGLGNRNSIKESSPRTASKGNPSVAFLSSRSTTSSDWSRSTEGFSKKKKVEIMLHDVGDHLETKH